MCLYHYVVVWVYYNEKLYAYLKTNQIKKRKWVIGPVKPFQLLFLFSSRICILGLHYSLRQSLYGMGLLFWGRIWKNCQVLKLFPCGWRGETLIITCAYCCIYKTYTVVVTHLIGTFSPFSLSSNTLQSYCNCHVLQFLCKNVKYDWHSNSNKVLCTWMLNGRCIGGVLETTI